jgi:hypothetical protein
MNLVLETIALRPYVFGFMAAFLIAGCLDVGWRRTLLFGAVVSPVAWLAEFSSTRTGIPFGLYTYTGTTRGAELYVVDVPFMDPISFAFLAYAAFCLARTALARWTPGRWALALGTGVLMMALDVVIDPLAVRGDRWFLGRIFYYVEGGAYFGVPLSNFVGWVLVGAVGVGLYLLLAGSARPASTAGGPRRAYGAPLAMSPAGERVWPGVALYYVVLGFNLAVTAWIGEWTLVALGSALHAAIGVAIRYVGREHGEAPVLPSRGVQRA